MSATLTPTLTHSADSPLSRFGAWINVVPHLDPKYGGISSVVPALASAVASVGRQSVSMAGFCAASESYTPAFAASVSLTRFPAGHAAWLRHAAGRAKFESLVRQSDGLHIHGLWESSTLAAAASARKLAKPYIVSAHGMLQSWAVNNKRWKKKIYGALFERANLAKAACLHALTDAEVADYRAYGLKNPVVVIPNGVDIPLNTTREPFLAAFPHLRQQRLVLFLSRIHFKKGLDILAQAWAATAARWPDAHLVLAGPDFENTRNSIESMLATLGCSSQVTFTGMLNSSLKWSALAAAECFVLPSYSEGLSVSVLEAMGMGLPVIISRPCNLPAVAEHDCGWTIEANAQELAAALESCLSASETSLAEMGLRGRSLVNDKYSWPVVGRQISALYSWVQSGGQPPAEFKIDWGNQ